MCCPLAVVAAAGELLLRSLSSALPSGVLRHIHTSHFKRYTSHVTPPTLHLTLHTSRVRRLFLSPLTPPLSSLVCYVTCTRHTSYLTRCAGAPAAPLSPKFLPPSFICSPLWCASLHAHVTGHTLHISPHTSHVAPHTPASPLSLPPHSPALLSGLLRHMLACTLAPHVAVAVHARALGCVASFLLPKKSFRWAGRVGEDKCQRQGKRQKRKRRSSRSSRSSVESSASNKSSTTSDREPTTTSATSTTDMPLSAEPCA